MVTASVKILLPSSEVFMEILRSREMIFPILPHLPGPAGIYSRPIDLFSPKARDGVLPGRQGRPGVYRPGREYFRRPYGIEVGG
jgi:hypothetical protein